VIAERIRFSWPKPQLPIEWGDVWFDFACALRWLSHSRVDEDGPDWEWDVSAAARTFERFNERYRAMTMPMPMQGEQMEMFG